MQRIRMISDRIVRILALGGAVGVVVMMLHVGADIVLRTLFDAPLPATIEVVSRYYMVLVAFLPLAWVERNNGMIAVGLIEGMLPKLARRVSDIMVAMLAAAIYAVMAYTTWLVALDNYDSLSFIVVLNSEVPVWPTYFLPPLGFALAMLATLLRAVLFACGHEVERRTA